MKRTLSALKLGLVLTGLALSMLIIGGCGKSSESEVKAPKVGVNVDRGNVIRGSGNVVTVDRAVNGFKRVSLTGVGDVIVKQGETESLTVEADDNLMAYVQAEVNNGTLVLGFSDEVRQKDVKPSTTIKFHVTMQDVTDLALYGVGDIVASALDTERLGIALYGVGDIEVSALNSERLEIALYGVGDVNISSLTAKELRTTLNGTGNVNMAGQVVAQGVFLNGTGDVRAPKLQSQEATVEVNGTGNVSVWATEVLDVRIIGPSTVEYYGDPRVTKNISLVGRLVSRGNP
jgi:hypothetical protein